MVEQKHLHKDKDLFRLKILLTSLLILILIFAGLLFQQYKQIRHLQHINQRGIALRMLDSKPKPLKQEDASSTQSWMTFDYINHVFDIPPEYLQNQLVIKDKKYPKITISNYSKESGLDQSSTLLKVQDFIRNFLNSKK